MRIASHLGMSVQRAQSEITSMEYLDWLVYLEEDINAFHREDYYFANIAATVFRGIAKNPNKVRLTDFLIEFSKKEQKKKLSKKETTERAKKFWGVQMAASCALPPTNKRKRKK